MGKNSTPLYLLSRKPIWVESYHIGQLWTIRVKICIAYPSKGHLRSPEVTNRHLPITFDQKEIETWDWCQYVRLGQANPMICNMTHFGHHVTLARLDLRSNFDLDLSKSFYIWFDAPSRDKDDRVKFVALPLKLPILLSKNRIGKFWNFDCWWPQFWPEPKNDRNDFEMIFRELSNAAFRFSLRRPGAEIMGGGRSNAPPSRRWKIQRPSRARVNPPHPAWAVSVPTTAWGGGGVGSVPPAISKTDGRRETDEAAFERSRRDASKPLSKI